MPRVIYPTPIPANIHPYSGLYFGMFPLEKICDIKVCSERKGQTNQLWNYFQSIPTYVGLTTIPHRWTDGERDRRTDELPQQYRASHSIAR